MIHPRQSGTLIVRSVFIINPKKVIHTILTYPASTGRDFGEIFRVIDSLQLSRRAKSSSPLRMAARSASIWVGRDSPRFRTARS